MPSPSILLWGIIFSSVGLGFFIYGKRQRAIVPLLTGIALMFIPFVISNPYVLFISGSALVALPYFIRM